MSYLTAQDGHEDRTLQESHNSDFAASPNESPTLPKASAGVYVYSYVVYVFDVYMYIHTYIYIYIHTYIHTYIPTYLHIYIYIYVHRFKHTPGFRVLGRAPGLRAGVLGFGLGF